MNRGKRLKRDNLSHHRLIDWNVSEKCLILSFVWGMMLMFQCFFSSKPCLIIMCASWQLKLWKITDSVARFCLSLKSHCLHSGLRYFAVMWQLSLPMTKVEFHLGQTMHALNYFSCCVVSNITCRDILLSLWCCLIAIPSNCRYCKKLVIDFTPIQLSILMFHLCC